MVIYFSGNTGLPFEAEIDALIEAGAKHRCFSYWYVSPDCPGYSKGNRQAFDYAISRGVHVFLDSGAHTLQRIHGEMGGSRQKVEGGLEAAVEKMFKQYCAFCHEYKDKVDCYVTFDYKSNAEVTWEMTSRMWKDGLEPVPVFHGDVDPRWLLKYVKHGCEWLGISGLIGNQVGRGSRTSKYDYLDTCFGVLAESKTKAKVHAFAGTGLELLEQYPWYSTDSSAWVQTLAYGCVKYPDFDRKRFVTIHVSRQGVSSARSSMTYWTLSSQQKKEVDAVLARYGADVGELSKDGREGRLARLKFNIKAFLEAQNFVNRQQVKFKPRHQPLFG